MSVVARERTVYHIGPLRMWLATGSILVGALLLLGGAALSPHDPSTQRALVLSGMFLLACAGVLCSVLRYTRLVLSKEGVTLYQVGYTLETAWDNVDRLYDRPGSQGLILHRPMEGRGASVLRAFRNTGVGAGVPFYRDEQVLLLTERRFVPIDAFAHWLRRGRLRDDLLRRIPSRVTDSTPGG